MKRLTFLVLILILASYGGSNAQDFSDNTTKMKNTSQIDFFESEYVPGEILVKFKPNVFQMTISSFNSGIGVMKLKELKPISVQHLKLPQGMTVKDALTIYTSNPNVEYVEPNYIYHLYATPDDTYFDQLWGLDNTGQTAGTPDADIDAPEAWDITTGSSSVVIAVTDSGVAYNHPDLSGNIWKNPGETDCTDGIDNDNNGYIDDCYGWDFIGNDSDPTDYNTHGTHVAGTIAAVGNNSTGITGVMWKATIMPVRIGGVSGSIKTSSAADAIIYAVNNGADIINASWGGYNFSQTIYDAINDAASKNVLFVAAAGNDSNDNDTNPSYPASYDLPNIISVAATDDNDNLASYSNYGATSVDVAAPGGDTSSGRPGILSTIPVITEGSTVLVYSEDFDSASGDLSLLGWDREGTNSTWAVTAGTGVGGTNSLEDSPLANYLDDTDSWAGYMTPIPSVKDNHYYLFLDIAYELESDLDYMCGLYSTDGVSWNVLENECLTGSSGGVFISLSSENNSFTNLADLLDSFYFGFGLKSDSSLTYDGVYIDNVLLGRWPLIIAGYDYDDFFQGTSMAAPHVSGIAGLILSLNPTLTYSQVKDIILNTVDLKASLSSKVLTGGRVNAYTSVLSVLPAAPSGLTAIAVSSSQIDLSWTDVSNEDGYKIESKTGVNGTYSEITTVSADTITYSDTGLSASTTYYYRVKAYNLAGDSAYSNEASATTSAPPSSDDGDGGGGGGCFIATAAYGSLMHPYVSKIREFRDRHLLNNYLGKAFVEFYYKHSPGIADVIRNNETLKAIVRVMLFPVVMSVVYPYTSMTVFIAFLVGGAVLIGRVKRQRLSV